MCRTYIRAGELFALLEKVTSVCFRDFPFITQCTKTADVKPKRMKELQYIGGLPIVVLFLLYQSVPPQLLLDSGQGGQSGFTLG